MVNNTFHDCQYMGSWRASLLELDSSTVYAPCGGPVTQDPQTNGMRLEWNHNTFYSTAPVVVFGDTDSATFQNNVIWDQGVGVWITTETSPLGDWTGSDLDNNCFFVSDSTTVEMNDRAGTLLAAWRSDPGMDNSSPFTNETDSTVVFSDPVGRDFTLIGAAATTCSGKGAW
jgi:hypothetical protein